MNPGDLDWEGFDQLGEIVNYEHTTDDELLERVQSADIIVTNKTIIHKELIEQCHNLKLICVSATGFNNVDVDYAASKGIPVCNASDYSNTSVAQHVISVLLNVYNKTMYYAESVQKGRWENSRDFTYYDDPIEELNGKNFGIIGFGSIGQAVAKVAEAFGANIKIMAHPTKNIVHEVYEVLSQEAFLENCDVISIHVPLTNSTSKMVNSAFLNSMKSSAVLINTARGGVVDEDAMFKVLKDKGIRAACLDVLTQEPPKKSPLFTLENCYVTPHQAWASKQSRERLMKIVIDNISNFRSGKIINKVN